MPLGPHRSGLICTAGELVAAEKVWGHKSNYAFKLSGEGRGRSANAAATSLCLEGAPLLPLPGGGEHAFSPCAAGRVNDPRPLPGDDNPRRSRSANLVCVQFLCGGVAPCCPSDMTDDVAHFHTAMFSAPKRTIPAGEEVRVRVSRRRTSARLSSRTR